MKVSNLIKLLSLSGLVFLMSCGSGSVTGVGNPVVDDGGDDGNLTKVPNPVQQALAQDAPAEAGAMINTLLQSGGVSPQQVGQALRTSVSKRIKALTIGDVTTCSLARGQNPDQEPVFFVSNPSAGNLESRSYGSREDYLDPITGEQIYNFQIGISEANKNSIFCNQTNEDGSVGDPVVPNPQDAAYDEVSELFASFDFENKILRCDGIRTPAEIAEEDEEVDAADVEIISDYIALSGNGISRVYPPVNNGSEPNTADAPLVVYGSFSISHVVEGAVDGDAVSVDCTFLISASGFFLPESICTGSNGTAYDLNSDPNGQDEGRTCEFVGDLADVQ